jgi:hypothetical protein
MILSTLPEDLLSVLLDIWINCRTKISLDTAVTNTRLRPLFIQWMRRIGHDWHTVRLSGRLLLKGNGWVLLREYPLYHVELMDRCCRGYPPHMVQFTKRLELQIFNGKSIDWLTEQVRPMHRLARFELILHTPTILHCLDDFKAVLFSLPRLTHIRLQNILLEARYYHLMPLLTNLELWTRGASLLPSNNGLVVDDPAVFQAAFPQLTSLSYDLTLPPWMNMNAVADKTLRLMNSEAFFAKFRNLHVIIKTKVHHWIICYRNAGYSLEPSLTLDRQPMQLTDELHAVINGLPLLRYFSMTTFMTPTKLLSLFTLVIKRHGSTLEHATLVCYSERLDIAWATERSKILAMCSKLKVDLIKSNALYLTMV